ncbi:cytochrome c maturation protein CcmE [Eisenibacter elegans]|jgi:cytochrome c-type biogenesis protein CcmE|uniref:cytochrome c maturation protein CcmE domain-containing protein n=1 Tax=Eisenibacter elegans TaxID=997 RepID=UPI00040D4CE4|nr:cytochrome c maturation protein CcmE [Eisenibacter elegans]
MKISHIIVLVVIAVVIGIIVSTTGNASQYVTFSEAKALAEQGRNNQIHVVGTLQKNEMGQIVGMHYDPIKDPNYFEFILIDNDQKPQRVVYSNPKPADFERSEQVVIIGKMVGEKKDTFLASKILMKCPSKYQENEFEIKEASIKP